MTASPIFQQLCCQLVEDFYGDFYATIFECLIASRRHANQVAQKCHLPLHQAKAGLAGLVQLKLVHHHTVLDAPTLYSANLLNAYSIIRAGKLLQAAQHEHSELGGRVMAIACDLGFATIGELRDQVLCQVESASMAEVENAIHDLLAERYLTHLRKAHFAEPHDIKRAVETSIMPRAEITRLSGSRAKADFLMSVNERLRAQLDTHATENGHVNDNWRKQRANGNQPNGNVTGTASTGKAILLQPNYHKAVSMAQASIASDMVRKLHGQLAGDLVACIVRKASHGDAWSQLNPEDIFSISVSELREDFNNRAAQQGVSDVKAKADHAPNGSTINGHGPKTGNGVPVGVRNDEESLSNRDVNRELLYLSEGTLPFLTGSNDNWMVAKDLLNQSLKQEEILRVMDSRLEPPAPRILRILIEKGKLEERTLQEIGLLGAKELRQTLSSLKQMGYLDLQEVPRNNQRMPNQTTFLWSHEARRVHHLVLEHTYSGISKLLQMLKLERDKIGGTLAKIERDDVKGRENDMLAEAEFLVLQRFRRVEAWVWGEIHRLDTTVAILRDT